MKTTRTASYLRNLLLAALVTASISAAHAQLFVVSEGDGTVNAYNTNGTPIGSGPLISGVNFATGITSANGDLFVSSGAGAVYEYTLTGTQVGSGPLFTLSNPSVGIVASGSTLFVSSFSGDEGGGSVAAYSISGATLNVNLITGLNGPAGMAVSGSNLFVVDGISNTINEYLLDGTQVGAGPLVSGLSGPAGIAIIGSNMFVTNYNSGTTDEGSILEYTLTGSMVGTGPLVSGLSGPTQIAAYGTDLYVTFKDSGAVVEYDSTTGAMVGTGPLVSDLNFPYGVVVVPEPSTWVLLTLGLGMLGYGTLRWKRKASQ